MRSLKSFGRLTLSLFLLSLAAESQATLLHRWSFSETSGTNVADSVGAANGGIIALGGAIDYAWTNGRVRLTGGAKATADYVRLPANLLNGLSNVTIETWIRPLSAQNWSRAFDFGSGAGTANTFFLSLCIGTSLDEQRLEFLPYTFNSELVTIPGEEYHYVVTWSATGGTGGVGRMQWYRNGTLVGGIDTGAATVANVDDTVLWLGRSQYPDNTANAEFNEFRIYDEILDGQTVLQHTLKGPDNTGPDSVEGLTHRWSFSETNGTTFQDAVGNVTGNVIVLGGVDYTLANGQVSLAGGAKGNADYVEFPSGLLDGLTNVTVEIWATPQAAQNWSRLFDFGSGAGTAGTWFLSLCIANDLNFQRLEYGAPAVFQFDSAVATPTDQQYHYVVVWGATNGTGGVGRMQWYRDGVLIGGVDTGSSTVSVVNDTILWLGRSQYPDNTASADYNELRIYNRVLTEAEINFNRIVGPDVFDIPAPTAVNDSMTLNPGAMALIPVLANDFGGGINPSSVTIVNPPSSGTAQVKPDGKVLYTHGGGPGSSDSFTYTVQNSINKTSNVATVSLTISSALRLPNTTMTIPDTAPPVSYQFVDAFPGLFFEDAVAMRTPPGKTNQLFVVERRGIVSYIPDINAAVPARQVFLDIRDQVQFDDTDQGEMGLMSMAFHPGFATNGIFFAFYIAPGPRQDRLSRFTANPTTLTVDTNTQQILISVVDQVFNHNGGDIHFGPDGYLYVGTGDEGDQYNFRENSQRIDKDFYSGILRIDVDKKPGSIEPKPHSAVPTNGLGQAFYSIPPSNPWVNATTFDGKPINTNALRAEFFAVGFRHVWRFSIDTNGEIWVGDVGQDRWEEVNVITNGANCGWAYYEGTNLAITLYPGQSTILTNPPAGTNYMMPIYAYTHNVVPGGDPQFKGNSISGGVVYHGDQLPEFKDTYIFGDFESAHIWSLRRTNSSVTVQRIGSTFGAAAFGIHPGNGEVLIANYVFNQIQRIVRTDDIGSSFPPKLSDTGIFADLATLSPNPGIVNYEPIVAFWSDHAIKRRWFTIPDLTNKVSFAVDNNWTFPTSMKWIKHFDLELERGNPSTKKRIETRVLVKTDTGTFGVSYKWNDAQTDATLVADGGTNFMLSIQDGTNLVQQQWEVPSRTACLVCHTPVAGHALSFNTRELNQTATMNGVSSNQIAALSQAGYFTAPVSNFIGLPALAHATNSNYSLEFRVRSYLAVNCVQCHQPGGAGPATWDARPYLTMAQTGLINGMPNDNGNDPLNRFIVSGDLAHSVLLQRIKGNGFSRMPPLATHELDQGAINLLTQWISTELTNRQDFAQWQVANFGSTNNPSAAANADPDNDGANNYYEFLTMTSPLTNSPLWEVGIFRSGNTVNVDYLRLANRGFLIESSPNLFDWSPWNVPGNQIVFGASNYFLNVSGPLLPTNQFFRVHIFEP